jgi:hypothetical protein
MDLFLVVDRATCLGDFREVVVISITIGVECISQCCLDVDTRATKYVAHTTGFFHIAINPIPPGTPLCAPMRAHPRSRDAVPTNSIAVG